jgi:hypothetical protein
MRTYPVYHAHKSSYQLKSKRLADFFAVPVFFTFLGLVLCAFGTNRLLAEKQAQVDALKLKVMMSEQEILPPPVL